MDQRRFAHLVIGFLAIVIIGAPLAIAAEPAADLKSALRDDAFGVIYVPSIEKLIEGISKFVPGGQMVGVQATNVLAQIGLPKDETLKAPLAGLLLPPAEGNDNPHFVILLGLAPGKWLDAKGEADADGIYEIGDRCLMVYKGFIAFAPERDDLLVLNNTAEKAKPYLPTPQAAKLMDKAQAFIHVNLALVLQTYENKIKEGRDKLVEKMKAGDENNPGNIMPDNLVAGGFDFMITLAKEVRSADVALGFDPEGLKLDGVTSVDPAGHISRYVSAMGKPAAPQAKLPVLQQYVMACWLQADPKVIDMLLTDSSLITDWLMKEMKPEAGKGEAIAAAMKIILEKHKGMLGRQMAFDMALGTDGMAMASVVDLLKPDEYRKLLPETIAAYNKLLPDMMQAMTKGQVDAQYIFEPAAETVAGTKVDRLKMVMTADTVEKQAALDKAMAMYGPNGFEYLMAVTGDQLVSSMGDEVMAKALAAAQGNGEVLNDDQTVKKLKEKLSPGQNVLMYMVPARFEEFGIVQAMKQMGRPAPNPIPFATPLVAGMRPLDAKSIACELYLPQACIMECISAAMPMMGGGPAPPPGDNDNQNLDNEDDGGGGNGGAEDDDAPADDKE